MPVHAYVVACITPAVLIICNGNGRNTSHVCRKMAPIEMSSFSKLHRHQPDTCCVFAMIPTPPSGDLKAPFWLAYVLTRFVAVKIREAGTYVALRPSLHMPHGNNQVYFLSVSGGSCRPSLSHEANVYSTVVPHVSLFILARLRLPGLPLVLDVFVLTVAMLLRQWAARIPPWFTCRVAVVLALSFSLYF